METGLGYVPYERLGERPHVMVDGAQRRSSVLTLSHWPASPTPKAFWRDLSAQSVLAFLAAARGRLDVPADAKPEVARAVEAAEMAEAVTNDHFDEDGLMSVWSAMVPDSALRVADLVVDVASCGDFGVVSSDEAAQVSFAVGPLAEEVAGPGAGTGERYLAMLGRVAELLGHPARYRRYWADEFAAYELGKDAIAEETVMLETDGAVDLAVVSRPSRPRLAELNGRLPGAAGGLPIHPVAVHSATTASRVLAFDGDFCECYFRYEGWVRYLSREVPLRPDLAPLAAELSSLEPGDVFWEANPVGAIVGRLQPSGEGRTEIAPEKVNEVVVGYLASSPPAWDPFRVDGGYIPESERASYRRRR